MQLNPYLSFNGQCATAFKFYEQCLGGKIEAMMTYGESPMSDQTPAEWHDKIMHTQLKTGDMTLMGADAPPDMYEAPRGFSVMLGINDPVEAEHIFKLFAENGTVQMPIQKTFWAEKFGMVTDQFGTPWAINCDLVESI